jgi:hypothetical protein
MPAAIVETLLEVCFGELFLAADAAAPLFEARASELALLVAPGFAAPLFDVVERVALLLEDAGLALVFGAVTRAPLLLLLDDAALAPPALPPREPVVPLPVLPAISQLPCIASPPRFGATDLLQWRCLASCGHTMLQPAWGGVGTLQGLTATRIAAPTDRQLFAPISNWAHLNVAESPTKFLWGSVV